MQQWLRCLFVNIRRTLMPPRTKKRTMSNAHKDALAEGRNHARAVGRYLEATEAHKPKRGRKRTAESVKKRLTQVEASLADATAIQRLNLLQERRDLEVELAGMQAGTPDLSALEKEFVKVAKAYGAKKGVSYGAWREFGVSPDVLKKAGITRGS
jgi:transposase